MKSTKTLILATLLFAALAAPAYSQVIKPDTLADLKAEAARSLAIAEPYIANYEQAKSKRYACALRTFDNPLTTFCDFEIRDLRMATVAAEGPMDRAVAAKEVYERELRKAERNKK